MRVLYLAILLLFPSIMNSQSIGRFYDYFCIEDSLLYEGQIIDVPFLTIRLSDPTVMKHYCVQFQPVMHLLATNPNSEIEIRIHNALEYIFPDAPAMVKEAYNPEIIADSIKLFLVSFGISPDRIEASGYFWDYPIVATKGIAEDSKYIDVGDTLDYNLLNEINTEINASYTNKRGKITRRKRYEDELFDIQATFQSANTREELVIKKL